MSSRDWIQRARVFQENDVISAERMRVIEKNAQNLGLSPDRLMEAAGYALARAVLEKGSSRPLVLCGKGNNGGDGLVAARYLAGVSDVTVCYHDSAGASPLFLTNLCLLEGCTVTLHPVRTTADVHALHDCFGRADLILDAMLGIGARGPVGEPLASMITEANASGVAVVSADVPTPGIRPSCILAFHRGKTDGSEVADIGIPLEADIVTGPGDLLIIPGRASDAHKGAGGRVLVIGGGPYQGAPYLAGLAALRAGADLVRVASPAGHESLDLIREPLPGNVIGEEHREILISNIRKSDVVVCGSGAGPGARAVIREVAPLCRKAVFDADALDSPLPLAETAIYTPHSGEFSRMTGGSPPVPDIIERAHAVKAAAAGIPRGVVLLKGEVDVISDGRRVRFNRTGCPAMTVGGTGDVLAGVAGALLCRLPAFEAAFLAAYANGKAGEAAAVNGREGILASDLLNNLPGILYGGCDRD